MNYILRERLSNHLLLTITLELNRVVPPKDPNLPSLRNHNVTEASYFRLVGVDNTADFIVPPGGTQYLKFDVSLSILHSSFDR